jgi:hypothetical protein
MAEKKYERLSADVEFADGVTRKVKPLTIASLRKFVKAVEDLSTENMNDEAIDQMVNAAKIVVQQVDPELANNPEKLEEALDMDVFQKIMTVAMGNKLIDPNE